MDLLPLLLVCNFAAFFKSYASSHLTEAERNIFIVDGEHGDDDNNGFALDQAFKTIERCVDELKLNPPGSECLLRAGRYHELVTIKGLKGSAEEPYIIRGYEDERPTWDGTIPIQPSHWDFDVGTGICSATIEEDIFALLLDDDLLTAARWPNALWCDKTAFNNSFWGKCSGQSSYGHIIDNGKAGLAESGINATGSMAILNIGSYETFVRPVLYHEPGTSNFTYNHDMGNVHWVSSDNQYYLEASLELLDAPGEWMYVKEEKVLYLISPNGNCPDSSSNLRGRIIDYGLIITNTTGLTIANMTFLATTVHAYSQAVHHKDGHIDEITLKSIQFNFPASSHRMLGSYTLPKNTMLMANSDSNKTPGRISVINCTFIGAEGVALKHDGINNLINNNLFWYNDWVGQDNSNGGTLNGWGNDEVFSHNTMWYNGATSGLRVGMRPTVEFNHVVGQCAGKIQNDGSGIQIQVHMQNGARVSHNWIHDSPKHGVRFDGNHGGHNGYLGHNVIWNTSGFMIKGDNHTVMNNMAVEDHLIVIRQLRHDNFIQNNHTDILNNVAYKADGGKNVFDGGRWPIQGEIIENNYFELDMINHTVDAANWDFRPAKGGALVQGDEVIGAYEEELDYYWIPGRKLYKTSIPIPPIGSTVDVTRDAVICLEAYEADKHHFYFGTDMELVDNATNENEEFQFSLNEGNIFHIPSLTENSTYFWRVDTQWGGYVYKGDVWNFKTGILA